MLVKLEPQYVLFVLDHASISAGKGAVLKASIGLQVQVNTPAFDLALVRILDKMDGGN
jgi:hypothetical protein